MVDEGDKGRRKEHDTNFTKVIKQYSQALVHLSKVLVKMHVIIIIIKCS